MLLVVAKLLYPGPDWLWISKGKLLTPQAKYMSNYQELGVSKALLFIRRPNQS